MAKQDFSLIEEYKELLERFKSILGDLFFQTEEAFLIKRVEDLLSFDKETNEKRVLINNKLSMDDSVLRKIRNLKLQLMIEMEKIQNLIRNSEDFFWNKYIKNNFDLKYPSKYFKNHNNKYERINFFHDRNPEGWLIGENEELIEFINSSEENLKIKKILSNDYTKFLIKYIASNIFKNYNFPFSEFSENKRANGKNLVKYIISMQNLRTHYFKYFFLVNGNKKNKPLIENMNWYKKKEVEKFYKKLFSLELPYFDLKEKKYNYSKMNKDFFYSDIENLVEAIFMFSDKESIHKLINKIISVLIAIENYYSKTEIEYFAIEYKKKIDELIDYRKHKKLMNLLNSNTWDENYLKKVNKDIKKFYLFNKEESDFLKKFLERNSQKDISNNSLKNNFKEILNWPENAYKKFASNRESDEVKTLVKLNNALFDIFEKYNIDIVNKYKSINNLLFTYEYTTNSSDRELRLKKDKLYNFLKSEEKNKILCFDEKNTSLAGNHKNSFISSKDIIEAIDKINNILRHAKHEFIWQQNSNEFMSNIKFIGNLNNKIIKFYGAEIIRSEDNYLNFNDNNNNVSDQSIVVILNFFILSYNLLNIFKDVIKIDYSKWGDEYTRRTYRHKFYKIRKILNENKSFKFNLVNEIDSLINKLLFEKNVYKSKKSAEENEDKKTLINLKTTTIKKFQEINFSDEWKNENEWVWKQKYKLKYYKSFVDNLNKDIKILKNEVHIRKKTKNKNKS